MSSTEGPVVFEFSGFRLEPQRRMLSRIDGAPVGLSDKALDTLVYLVERAGQLVTKDELVRTLWPTTVVEENNLYVVISALRRALKDDSAAERLIATVAGRGYQFVAEVRAVSKAAPRQTSSVPALDSTTPAPLPSDASRRRLAVAVGAVVMLVIGIGAAVIALRQPPASQSAASRATLAVLPFKPLTPDDRNESLELGMAETLIAGLNSGDLSVSPLSSVRRYAGIEQDGLAAGRALGVQTVLEGHLQRVGNQLRVSARLLNVSDGRQLWAQRYDEAFTDIFSLQDTIAAKVRAALAAELPDEAPALRRYTEDAEAYQLYANGRAQSHPTTRFRKHASPWTRHWRSRRSLRKRTHRSGTSKRNTNMTGPAPNAPFAGHSNSTRATLVHTSGSVCTWLAGVSSTKASRSCAGRRRSSRRSPSSVL